MHLKTVRWERRLFAPLLAVITALWFESFSGPKAVCATTSPASEEITTPLLVKDIIGCATSHGITRLRDTIKKQVDRDFFVIEAEDADEIRFQTDVWLRKAGRSAKEGVVKQTYARELKEYQPQSDTSASGGKYIDFTSQASYTFEVTRDGVYTMWSRYYVPFRGNWQHYVSMDGEEKLLTKLAFPDAKQWYWQKCHDFELKKGYHKFIVSDLHNGKRVDKILFIKGKKSSTEPSGLGPGTHVLPVNEGSIEFKPVSPFGLISWEKVELTGTKTEKILGADISCDEGKTWQPLSRDGSLKKVPVRRDGTDSLSLRLRLIRTSGFTEVKDAYLTYKISADSHYMLQDNKVEFRFSKRDGALVGLKNKHRGVNYSAFGNRSDLFDMFIRNPGEEGRILSFEDARFWGGRITGNEYSANWSLLEAKIKIRMWVKLVGGGLSLWRIGINNLSDYNIVETCFPRIQHLRIGEDSVDDVLAWPWSSGLFLKEPGLLGQKEVSYPGHMSMAFLDLYDKKCGIYIASHDPRILVLKAKAQGNIRGDRVDLSFTRLHRIKPGEKLIYTYAIGLHDGDWHWAADRYREFFYSHFEKPSFPEWINDMDCWQVGGMGMRTEVKERYYDELRNNYFPLALGINYLQMWGSTFNGACPTYYLPRKECGGEELLTQSVKWWRKHGGKIGFYFHGNSVGYAYFLMKKYFDTPWEQYPAELRPKSWDWYVRNRSYVSEEMKIDRKELEKTFADKLELMQTNPHRQDAFEEYSSMTFLSNEFPDFLRFWSNKYISDYGCNTIYYDTMAFRPVPEYNPFLGCFGEGNCPIRKLAFIKEVTKAMRKIDPDFVGITEGCGDIWGSYCISLLSGFSKDSELIRYTLPDIVLMEGHSNAMWGPGVREIALCKAFLFGNRFDLIHSLNNEFIRQALRLRKLVNPWLNRARFMDETGLNFDRKRISAKVFYVNEPRAKGITITCWNEAKHANQKIRCIAPSWLKIKRVLAFSNSSKFPADIDFRIVGREAYLVVPEDRLSAIILLEKAEGPFALTAFADAKPPARAELNLFSFASKPISVKVKTSSDVPLKPFAGEITLPPGEIVTVSLQAKDMSRMKTFEPLGIATTASGYERHNLVGLFPTIHNPSFELFMNAGFVKDKAFDGERSLKVMPGKYGKLVMFLRRNTKYNFSFAYKGENKPTVQAGRWGIPLKEVGQKKGWRIFEQEITGTGLISRVILRCHKNNKSPCYFDDFRATPVE